jgi:hypothetical protein
MMELLAFFSLATAAVLIFGGALGALVWVIRGELPLVVLFRLWIVAMSLAFLAWGISGSRANAFELEYPDFGGLCKVPKLACFIGTPQVKQKDVCGRMLTHRSGTRLVRKTIARGVEEWGLCGSYKILLGVYAMFEGSAIPPKAKP